MNQRLRDIEDNNHNAAITQDDRENYKQKEMSEWVKPLPRHSSGGVRTVSSLATLNASKVQCPNKVDAPG